MNITCVKNIQPVRNCVLWYDCMPKDTVAAHQVFDWPAMPLQAFNAFVKWTGLRFDDGTRLVRDGGDHIFAVHALSPVAVCVYRHSRKFGE